MEGEAAKTDACAPMRAAYNDRPPMPGLCPEQLLHQLRREAGSLAPVPSAMFHRRAMSAPRSAVVTLHEEPSEPAPLPRASLVMREKKTVRMADPATPRPTKPPPAQATSDVAAAITGPAMRPPPSLLASPVSSSDSELESRASAAQAAADAMGLFHGRYNAAVLETLALERHCAGLVSEQETLRRLIAHFAEGRSVAPAAIDGPNALLVVNGRSSDQRVAPLPRWQLQAPRLRGGVGLGVTGGRLGTLALPHGQGELVAGGWGGAASGGSMSAR